MNKDNGGTAFPFLEKKPDGTHSSSHPGMSLRDWFAGQIAAAAITNATGLGVVPKEDRATMLQTVAAISFELADAMLAARQAQP